MYRGLSKLCGCLCSLGRGESGGASVAGRERVREILFFGTGGGVRESEKNLTWCLEGSEQPTE